MALITPETASAPLTQKQRFDLASAQAEAKNTNPLLGGPSLLEQLKNDIALKRLASEGRVPQDVITPEVAPMPMEKFSATESRTPADLSNKYIDQNIQPVSTIQQQNLLMPETQGLTNIAGQEAKGVEAAINRIDKERSALDKKFEVEQMQLQDKLTKEEQFLRQKDDEIKRFQFDDRSLWDKSSTGQKIGLFIGGFLSSLNNQSAAAFRDSVQKAMDTDMILQNKKLDALKESKQMSGSLLGQLRQQLGDKERANLAYQGLLFKKMGSQLEANAAKFKSPIMAERAKIGAQEAYNASMAKFQQAQIKAAEKKPLGAESQQRLDNAKMALIGVQGMRQALDKGENTFSLIGDNDFTLNRDAYVEGLGRMQSGGAIGKDEQARFEKFTPGVADSAEMQRKKLAKAEAELKRRISAIEGQSAKDTSYFRAN